MNTFPLIGAQESDLNLMEEEEEDNIPGNFKQDLSDWKDIYVSCKAVEGLGTI